jgi:hypothetical protein
MLKVEQLERRDNPSGTDLPPALPDSYPSITDLPVVDPTPGALIGGVGLVPILSK